MAATKKPKKKVEEEEALPILQGQGMDKLQHLYNLWHGCARCPLVDLRPGPDIVFGEGNPNARVLIIGEGPGEEEERTSVPFVGPSGQLLNQMLALISDDPHIQEMSKWYDKVAHSKRNIETFHEAVFKWRKEEFFITNVVSCRPPENRQPNNIEVKACSSRVRSLIYEIDPLIIIAVGKTALESLVHKTSEITKKRGQLYEVEVSGRLGKVVYPVMPIFHPSYLLRKADWKIADGDYAKTLKDLYKALRLKDELMLQYYNQPIPFRVDPT